MEWINDKILVDGVWKLFKFLLFVDFSKRSKLGYIVVNMIGNKN